MSPTLTPDVREVIAPFVGEVHTYRHSVGGYSSDVTAVVEGSRGRFFIKGIRGGGGRRASLQREEMINPYIQDLSPPVLWRAERNDWLILGFEVLDGIRPTELEPSSPDRPLIVEALNQIGTLSVPEIAREWRETRWDRYVSKGTDRGLLKGDTLLYTDFNGNNLLRQSDRTWIVDWSWPTVGAAFIDPAMLVHQLIANGCTPTEAESWAEGCTAWQRADPYAIDVFVQATLRMYERIVQRRPDETWLKAVLATTQAWAEHRGVNR